MSTSVATFDWRKGYLELALALDGISETGLTPLPELVEAAKQGQAALVAETCSAPELERALSLVESQGEIIAGLELALANVTRERDEAREELSAAQRSGLTMNTQMNVASHALLDATTGAGSAELYLSERVTLLIADRDRLQAELDRLSRCNAIVIGERDNACAELASVRGELEESKRMCEARKCHNERCHELERRLADALRAQSSEDGHDLVSRSDALSDLATGGKPACCLPLKCHTDAPCDACAAYRRTRSSDGLRAKLGEYAAVLADRTVALDRSWPAIADDLQSILAAHPAPSPADGDRVAPSGEESGRVCEHEWVDTPHVPGVAQACRKCKPHLMPTVEPSAPPGDALETLWSRWQHATQHGDLRLLTRDDVEAVAKAFEAEREQRWGRLAVEAKQALTAEQRAHEMTRQELLTAVRQRGEQESHADELQGKLVTLRAQSSDGLREAIVDLARRWQSTEDLVWINVAARLNAIISAHPAPSASQADELPSYQELLDERAEEEREGDRDATIAELREELAQLTRYRDTQRDDLRAKLEQAEAVISRASMAIRKASDDTDTPLLRLCNNICADLTTERQRREEAERVIKVLEDDVNVLSPKCALLESSVDRAFREASMVRRDTSTTKGAHEAAGNILEALGFDRDGNTLTTATTEGERTLLTCGLCRQRHIEVPCPNIPTLTEFVERVTGRLENPVMCFEAATATMVNEVAARRLFDVALRIVREESERFASTGRLAKDGES